MRKIRIPIYFITQIPFCKVFLRYIFKFLPGIVCIIIIYKCRKSFFYLRPLDFASVRWYDKVDNRFKELLHCYEKAFVFKQIFGCVYSGGRRCGALRPYGGVYSGFPFGSVALCFGRRCLRHYLCYRRKRATVTYRKHTSTNA